MNTQTKRKQEQDFIDADIASFIARGLEPTNHHRLSSIEITNPAARIV